MACQFYPQDHQRVERPKKKKSKRLKFISFYLIFLVFYQNIKNCTMEHTRAHFWGCLLGEYMNREYSKQKLLNIDLVYPVLNERKFDQ
jgi:hypothetical protein